MTKYCFNKEVFKAVPNFFESDKQITKNSFNNYCVSLFNLSIKPIIE